MVPCAKYPGTALLAASLAISTFAFAGGDQFWKEKPASAWTLAETLKLLQDSPWSRQQVLARPILGSGADYQLQQGSTMCNPDAPQQMQDCIDRPINLPVDSSRQRQITFTNYATAVLLVRWESARPVAQAFLRLAELGTPANVAFLGPPPRLPPDRYVVTLKTLQMRGRIADPLVKMGTGEGKPRAWLKTSAGKVEALEWESSGVGASRALHFFFPRTHEGAPLIGTKRTTVEFVLEKKGFVLKSKFTLDPESLL